MIRKIIKIDEEKCNGCGICASACHEGAIEIIDGKAKLTREHYCDGLGDCLPACPEGAISFEEREAPAYDKEAVELNKKIRDLLKKAVPSPSENRDAILKNIFENSKNTEGLSCPGMRSKELRKNTAPSGNSSPGEISSELRQWPVQIKLAPATAPYFDNAKLLIAADCSAFSYGDFHRRFIRDHVCLIGCPKLDDIDYTEKLTEIIASNNIKSLGIVRMEVPCCGGLMRAATEALKRSGKFIPWQIYTISLEGKIIA